MSQENRGGKISLSDLRDQHKSESQQTQPRINTQNNNLNDGFYVASNAPPNYILNSQLTFYEA